MILNCEYCNKTFNKKQADIKRSLKHYCSRSCANKGSPKRKKTKKCKICKALIFSDKKRCPECIKNYIPKFSDSYKISEVIYTNHHKSSTFALIRTRARAIAKKLGWKSCKHCGYDKHIEICHIKPIKDFSEDSLISEVNHIDNLLPLCPNCHWEFDHKN